MDKRERLVTQANQLVEGAYEVNLIEMRLLYLALTKIDPRNPQPDGEYTIYASEYNNMYSLSKTGYEQLKSAVDSLSRKPVVTYYNGTRVKQRFWFSSIEYGVGGSESDVILRFSDTVREYLYELRKDFTQMNLNEIVKLDSPFAFRLYSWLYRYRNLDRYTNSNKVITTEPLGVEWMKERSGLAGKYPQLADFRRRVLDPAIDMINAHTNLSVTYAIEKHGRKVGAFIFSYIDEKEHASHTLAPTKPLRPRLPNRPRVTKGSAAEGEWARTCIRVIRDYQLALQAYSDKLHINAADLKKVHAWYAIIGGSVDKAFLKKTGTTA